MRYFLMEQDARYRSVPKVRNWFQLFQKRNIDRDRFDTIPKRMVLPILPNQDVMYVPMLFYPFFLVNELLKDCIALYEPNVLWKEFILLDSKYESFQSYFYPNLKKLDCLTERSVFNLDHSELTKIELDERKIGNCSIFQLQKVKNQYTAVRLDVLESLLRRGAEGITVKELDVRRNEG